jgi:hypothetical protein
MSDEKKEKVLTVLRNVGIGALILLAGVAAGYVIRSVVENKAVPAPEEVDSLEVDSSGE